MSGVCQEPKESSAAGSRAGLFCSELRVMDTGVVDHEGCFPM